MFGFSHPVFTSTRQSRWNYLIHFTDGEKDHRKVKRSVQSHTPQSGWAPILEVLFHVMDTSMSPRNMADHSRIQSTKNPMSTFWYPWHSAKSNWHRMDKMQPPTSRYCGLIEGLKWRTSTFFRIAVTLYKRFPYSLWINIVTSAAETKLVEIKWLITQDHSVSGGTETRSLIFFQVQVRCLVC